MNWPIALLMMMMFHVIKGAEGITAYNCLRPKFGQKYSLLDMKECPEASPISIDEVPEQVMNIYQESDFVFVEAKECKVTYIETAFRCGHGSMPVKPEYFPEPAKLTVKQWEEAFITGK